jgi:hypothetical protein
MKYEVFVRVTLIRSVKPFMQEYESSNLRWVAKPRFQSQLIIK